MSSGQFSFLHVRNWHDYPTCTDISAIALEQATPMRGMMRQRVYNILDYMHYNSDAITRCYHDYQRPLGCILPLSRQRKKPRMRIFFLLGNIPRANVPIQLNGNMYSTCAILKLVASSKVEEEVGALFGNTKEGKLLWLNLLKLEHPQPSTRIHIDNTVVVEIVNHATKTSKSRAMERMCLLLIDQDTQQYFTFTYVLRLCRVPSQLPFKSTHWLHTRLCASMLHTHEEFTNNYDTRSNTKLTA